MRFWLYSVSILFVTLCVWSFGQWSLNQQKEMYYETYVEQRSGLITASINKTQQLVFERQELLGEINSLERELGREQRKFNELEDEVGDSLKTVELLQKISETDIELLMKYSRVYFLNEHYRPSILSDIDEGYLLPGRAQLQVAKSIEPFLDELLEDASDDDIELRILSGYRSFETQTQLKSQYIQTFGTTAANTFSADQGYSEHQLGTTVDFTTPEGGANLSSFPTTDAFEWLQENAYRYGFVLSYPEGNAYYVYEPWHWRFVGKDLARDLHRSERFFYDLEQREINEYIANLFDD